MLGSGRGTQGSREPAAGAAPDTCDTLEAPADPDPPLDPGDTIDRYRIVRLIATGGMARVYEATHEWTHRSVALKIMHARYGCRSDLIERFRKEALALSAIAHVNVVSVENGGLTRDGFVFLATEMLQGQSLRQVLRERRRLPPREALEIVIQVARGVAAAHARNVIHRDLKPENIFCTREGVVKVLDLGIAKLIGYDAKETDPQLGFVAGTPAYMAPELLEAKRVGVTADVYALGVIAYELLAGHHPLTPDGVWPPPSELARRALAYLPPPLAGVSAELSVLIERAMHKSADRRHASMVELLSALESIQERTPVEAAVQTTSRLARRPARMRRVQSSLALLALLALGVAAAAYHPRVSAPAQGSPSLSSATRPTAQFVATNAGAWLSSRPQLRPSAAERVREPLAIPVAAPPAATALKLQGKRRRPSRLIARTFSADTAPPPKPSPVAPKAERAR